MAGANVQFYTLDHEPASPGEEQLFSFRCPSRGTECIGRHIANRTGIKRDPQGQNGGVAHWEWNGSRDSPTFSPSVNCQRCWHGYLRGGRTVSCAGTDEPEPDKA